MDPAWSVTHPSPDFFPTKPLQRQRPLEGGARFAENNSSTGTREGPDSSLGREAPRARPSSAPSTVASQAKITKNIVVKLDV